MSSLHPISSALHAIKRRQLTVRAYRSGYIHLRACSCSAAPQQQSETVASKVATSASLNPPKPPLDHRTLAETHHLFITSPYSPGSPLLLPNGAYIFQRLQSFLRAQYPKFGFQEVITPIIYKKSLWEKSGHWQNYAEDMFSVQARGTTAEIPEAVAGEDGEFGLKPMNCPGHCLLFRDQVMSYRNLPVRYADFSALHRNEISGALTGLTRVRRFHQDDAHIFCRPDQILVEIEQTLKFVGMVYDAFGLNAYKLLLSTRPQDNYIGTIEEWDRAEAQLKTALENTESEWAINEGDGAFYGPKIDIILKDSHGKEHQTATIQLDFQLPQRFDLQYKASPEEMETKTRNTMDTGLDASLRRPVMIHRAIYGSIERFMALLIEHYAGTYPLWFSPRPAIIMSLNDRSDILEYATQIQAVLAGSKSSHDSITAPRSKPQPLPLSTTQLPIDIDLSSRSLSKKIAEARNKRYNHIIIVGQKEMTAGEVSLRIASQPNQVAASEILERAMGRELSVEERTKMEVSIPLGAARNYFEGLVNSYL